MKTILGALVGLLVLAACGSDPGEPDGPAAPAAQAPATEIGGVPTRTESYRGVEVDVPATWGWGAAPSGETADPDVMWCTDHQVHLPSGDVVTEAAPYVGRPAMFSDVCGDYHPTRLTPPDAPYVWFGVPLEVGSATVGAWTIETREVAGVTVTVASRDDAERAAILGSARRLATDSTDANGCPVRPQQAGGLSREGYGAIHGMAVCVYRPRSRQPSLLFASARVEVAGARAFVKAAYADEGALAPNTCPRTREAIDSVLLVVDSDDDFGTPGARQHPQFVVDTSCGVLVDPHGTTQPLTRALVRPWAVPIVRAYVGAPLDRPGVQEYFRMRMG